MRRHFAKNEIDEIVLRTLTAEDLKELGVGPLGHRRKLLDAIADLHTGASLKIPGTRHGPNDRQRSCRTPQNAGKSP